MDFEGNAKLMNTKYFADKTKIIFLFLPFLFLAFLWCAVVFILGQRFDLEAYIGPASLVLIF